MYSVPRIADKPVFPKKQACGCFNGSVALGNRWLAIQWGLPLGTARYLLTTECEDGLKST